MINTYNEKPLHAALKEWYAQPGDQFEVPIDGYIIDIVRGDLLIEIQTRSFASLKRKLNRLTQTHPVRLVYPIAHEKWLVKLPPDATTPLTRRKSPKRGTLLDLFRELVSFPHLLTHPNFGLEALLIQEEEVRHHDPKTNWRRRGWATEERRLLTVTEQHLFATPHDLCRLLPATLDAPFTTADLAHVLACPRGLAQKMAYCLRAMGVLRAVGKQGNALLYTQSIE